MFSMFVSRGRGLGCFKGILKNAPIVYQWSLRAESEKWSNLPRNRLQQIQTFLTITVIFGQNTHDFLVSKSTEEGEGGCFAHSESIRFNVLGYGCVKSSTENSTKKLYLLNPSHFFLLNPSLLYMNTGIFKSLDNCLHNNCCCSVSSNDGSIRIGHFLKFVDIKQSDFTQ